VEPYVSACAVLMPSFGNCRYRQENQKFVQHWYTSRNFTVVLGHDTPKAGGHFSRARAINNAARETHKTYPEKTIYILADNDLIPSAAHLTSALEQVSAYSAVIPHSTTLYSSNLGRLELLKGSPTFRYQEKATGSASYVVISSSAFAQVNGMDERFEGWGPEDQAFVWSIKHQLSEPLRLEGARTHLWHPQDNSKRNRQQLLYNRQRCRDYAQGDKATATVLAREYGSLFQ
jgi:hypothetical protein